MQWDIGKRGMAGAIVLLGCVGCAGPDRPTARRSDLDATSPLGRALMASIENVLEVTPSAVPVPVDVPGAGRGAIIVTKTVQRADGIYCRSFEVRFEAEPEQVIQGQGCRVADRAWELGAPSTAQG
jgi:hypothetical protein